MQMAFGIWRRSSTAFEAVIWESERARCVPHLLDCRPLEQSFQPLGRFEDFASYFASCSRMFRVIGVDHFNRFGNLTQRIERQQTGVVFIKLGETGVLNND